MKVNPDGSILRTPIDVLSDPIDDVAAPGPRPSGTFARSIQVVELLIEELDPGGEYYNEALENYNRILDHLRGLATMQDGPQSL